MPNTLGVLVDVGTACKRCWEAFIGGWQSLGWTWNDVCGMCVEKPDMNTKFETSCALLETSDGMQASG